LEKVLPGGEEMIEVMYSKNESFLSLSFSRSLFPYL
jgi:hypothetical protein